MPARPKIPDLIKLVKEKAGAGKIRYSSHANQRMLERDIIKPDVEHVLLRGHHNKQKDTYNEKEGGWDYSIEGKTIDGRKLRIIVAIIDPNLLVVTTIDLDSGE